MYETCDIVRYSETDSKGVITLKSVVDRFQDSAYFELTELGLGGDYFAGRNTGWFVFFWQINVVRAPRRDERIAVGTLSCETGGISEHRNQYIKDYDGNVLVQAYSVWSLVDLGQMRITRIPDEVRRKHVGAPQTDKSYPGRRIQIPSALSFEEIGVCTVAPWQLDSNCHLNNSWYIAMALAKLKMSADEIGCICVEYQSQASEGARIRFLSAREGKTVYLVCLSDEGKSFCRMRIEKRI